MAWHSDAADTAARVLDLATSRPPTLGTGRLVAIDGPSCSGKTSLGRRLAAASDGLLLHMDDMYDGWHGLGRVHTALHDMLSPLAAGREGSYRHYDWRLGRFSHVVTVAPSPMLILEGVGSGCDDVEPFTTVLVWLDADEGVRRARGASRTPPFVDHWDMWADQEAEHFAANSTRRRADLRVDTT